MLLKFREKLTERGSLPAVMGAAILISATAVLLAAFSVATTRNGEMAVAKTSLNAAITSCEATLSTVVYKHFRDEPVPAQALIDEATNKCNYDSINTVVRVEGTPEKYTPSGETRPMSVRVNLVATHEGMGSTSTSQVRYLKYAEKADVTVTPDSFIASFDADGNAVWVTPE